MEFLSQVGLYEDDLNNYISEINIQSNSFRWLDDIQTSKTFKLEDISFKIDSQKTETVRSVCLNGYLFTNADTYIVELLDKQYNKYFLSLRINNEYSAAKKLDDFDELIGSLSDGTKTIIKIPFFEIQIGDIFLHVGEDGIKTVKKKVYQDISSFLEFIKTDTTESNQIDSPFFFYLKRENSNEHLYGICNHPSLEQVKESVVKQFNQAPCFEKLIFSCHQEKKSFFQLFTNFFVIIDRSFLFDTFNYWHDKTSGIEYDYNLLVQKDGIPFNAAQQHLMDPLLTIEGFITSFSDDLEQANDISQNADLFLRDKIFNKDQEKIIYSVFCLYGLLHAKYILTPPGQAKMLELYVYNSFPKCPRSKCKGIRCFPYGITEKPCCQQVKLFCPKCETIYNYYKNSLDGAFFGPTYVHLLMKKFPNLKKFDDDDQLQKNKEFTLFGIPLMSKEELDQMNSKVVPKSDHDVNEVEMKLFEEEEEEITP